MKTLSLASKLSNLLKGASLFSLLIGFASCGSNPPASNEIVKDITLETSVVDGDIWVSTSAVFYFGGMSLTSVSLPVVNPQAPEELYGQLNIRPYLTGDYSEVEIMVNLTNTAKLQGGAPSLPNGNALPVYIPDEDHLIELAIDQIHSKVYVGLSNQMTMIGFAIGIKEFEAISQYVPGANLFLGFNIKGVRGTAGLFTGVGTYANGLGLFADMSSVINTSILNDIISGAYAEDRDLAMASSSSLKTLRAANFVQPTQFIEQKLSKSQQKKVNTQFYNMMRKGSKLNVQ